MSHNFSFGFRVPSSPLESGNAYDEAFSPLFGDTSGSRRAGNPSSSRRSSNSAFDGAEVSFNESGGAAVASVSASFDNAYDYTYSGDFGGSRASKRRSTQQDVANNAKRSGIGKTGEGRGDSVLDLDFFDTVVGSALEPVASVNLRRSSLLDVRRTSPSSQLGAHGGYEDDILHIIDTAYASANGSTSPSPSTLRAGADRGSSSNTPSKPTGPQAWPMPPTVPSLNHVHTHDRSSASLSTSSRRASAKDTNGFSEDMQVILDYHLSPADAYAPLPSPRTDAAASAAATTRKPAAATGNKANSVGSGSDQKPPRDARFSPELVALTTSGMNLAEIRRAAKQLDLPQRSAGHGSFTRNSLYDEGSMDDEAAGYSLDLGTGTSTGKQARAGQRGKTIFPSEPPLRQMVAARPSPSNLHGAKPRRRWSDETHNTTIPMKKQISPLPRNPQSHPTTNTPSAALNGAHRGAAASVPVWPVNSGDSGDSGNTQGYDYGISGAVRRNSEPLPQPDRSAFGAPSTRTLSSAPSTTERTKGGRPRSPRQPVAMTSPFPPAPVALSGGGGGNGIDAAALAVWSPTGQRSTVTPTTAINTAVEKETDTLPHSGSLLSDSTSKLGLTTSGRLQRPKPTATKKKPGATPALLPSLDPSSVSSSSGPGHTPKHGGAVVPGIGASRPSPDADLSPSLSGRRQNSSNGPSSTTSSTTPTPRANSNSNSTTTTTPAAAAAKISPLAKDGTPPPRKIALLPAIAVKKPSAKDASSASPTTGSTLSDHSTTGNISTSTINSGQPRCSPRRNADGTATATTAGMLLPPPRNPSGILVRRPVYVRGSAAEARRKKAHTRSLPNGKRRADWTAPETNYITCLSTSAPFEGEEGHEDDGDKDAPLPVSSANTPPLPATANTTASHANGRTTPLPQGGKTTPSPNTSYLVIDEVERVRMDRQARAGGRPVTPSPDGAGGGGAASMQESPRPGPRAAPVAAESYSPLTPLTGTSAFANAMRAHPARPSSRNSDNASDNASFTFMHVGRKSAASQGRADSSPGSTNNRTLNVGKGSSSSVTSNSYTNIKGSQKSGGAAGSGVHFAADTIFYENEHSDLEYDDGPEMDSGELVDVDA